MNRKMILHEVQLENCILDEEYLVIDVHGYYFLCEAAYSYYNEEESVAMWPNDAEPLDNDDILYIFELTGKIVEGE